MSKLFEISGELMNNDLWLRNVSIFEGVIFVEDEKVIGYCRSPDGPKKEQSEPYFLVGRTAKNEQGVHGMALYELSNDPQHIPIMFLTTDLRDPIDSSWARINVFGYFQFQGKAMLSLREMPAFNSRIHEIRTTFEKIDRTIAINDDLLSNLDNCEQYIINAITT